MNSQQLEDILATHADRLINGGAGEALSTLSSSEQEEFESLSCVAEQIHEALTPVTPSATFRQRTRRHLMDVARQRQRQIVLGPPPPNRWLMGAAIGSAMAVAGGIAYLLRLRGEEHSQQVVEAKS